MRRGSISSWEPWARRNSANMAQITGSRSEFMTSDLRMSDMEYKKKGGCFLSYKKVAGMIVMFIVGVIAAALIGAYISPWNKNRSPTALPLIEEDEVQKISSRFSVSTSVYPSLYTIELTPMEEETSMKLKGRVVIEFIYNGSYPLLHLVLNAKGILVSKAKLVSFEKPVPGNVHSRRRREEYPEIETPDSNNSTETTPSDFETTISIGNDTGVPENSSIIEDSLSNDVGSNVTTFNDTKIEDIQISYPTSKTPSDFVSPENEIGKVSSTNLFPSTASPTTRSYENGETVSREIWNGNGETNSVDELYVICPGTEIPRGSYSLEIIYEAKLDRRNTLANNYKIEDHKSWLLATKLKPRNARTLFPGFHDRNSRAKFSLSIARPKTLITLFNMPLKSSDSISKEWTMDHFETSPPLKPDSLAFAVSDLQPIAKIPTGDSNAALTLWSRRNKIGKSHYITNCFSTVARLLSQYFSSSNPLPKLDVAAIPRIIDEGSGNSGLLFVRESLFNVTEDSSPVLRERTVMTVVKLIAEQWLGGLVSTKSLTDAWIFEGSLIYLQHLLADEIDPTIGSINFIGGLQHAVQEADAYQEAKSLSSRTSLASFEQPNLFESSRKGACLIRMMHSVLSDSGLRNGYEKLISRWKNSDVNLSDFFASMSNDAQLLPDGLSLAQMMTSWVNQPGFPLVTVTRNYETGSAIFRQERFIFGNSTPTKPQLWHVPITYVLDGENRWSSPSRIWLRQEQELTIKDVGRHDEKKWLLVNVNQSGYYRVNYDEDNWKLLAVSLNSTLNKFPVTTRSSLVDDALTMAWGGRLKYKTALNLINYLVEKESHHSPWNVAFENMVKINNLLYNTPAYRSFQGFMAKFISPLFEKVTASSDRSHKLKLIAIKWACLVDNPACRTYLNSSVPEYLEDTHRCIVARFGGKSEWDTMILNISNLRNSETDRLRIFGALPCFRIEWILQSLLDGMLKDGKFDVSETLALLRSFGENPMAAKSAFKYMRGNWNKIFEKYSKSYQISRAFVLASMKGIADDQDLKDFQIFKEEHREKLQFMGHTIALAEAEARSRNFWLKKNLISVQKLFEEYEIRTS